MSEEQHRTSSAEHVSSASESDALQQQIAEDTQFRGEYEVNASRSRFDEIKTRLDELVNLVSNDDLPLDVALDYYEEAVDLGIQASSLLEEGIALEQQSEINVVESAETRAVPIDSVADNKNAHDKDDAQTVQKAAQDAAQVQG